MVCYQYGTSVLIRNCGRLELVWTCSFAMRTGLLECCVQSPGLILSNTEWIEQVIVWRIHSELVGELMTFLSYLLHALPRRHPSPKPVGVNVSHIDSLRLCAACVKSKLWRISVPDTPDIVQGSYVKTPFFFTLPIFLPSVTLPAKVSRLHVRIPGTQR